MPPEQTKDLVLPPGVFAYVLDTQGGTVLTVVGSSNHTLTGTQYPVVWNSDKRQFDIVSDQTRALQSFISVPQGSYVVLEAPSAEEKDRHPKEGNKSPTIPDLKFGERVNMAGPKQFALWPRQTARVIPGHQLKSNQYLIVRVYDDGAARANWSAAVVQVQTEQSGDTSKQTGAERQAPTSRGLVRPETITMGQLLIIKGTDVKFYIPPTGVEVLLHAANPYVRDAVTLERLEYCILLDESGNKRFVRGPDVVFPEPNETFVEMGGKVKFNAIELNVNSGLHVKVIADYRDENGVMRRVGEELFITGKEQAIYFPRQEHSIITYGDQQIHFATAVPEGEGRYVLDRDAGDVNLKKGPEMLLPDPRRYVTVRRILDEKICSLLYPDNTRALAVNRQLADLSRSLPAGEYLSHRAVETRSLAAKEGLAAVAAESFQRRTAYTPPRTITLDTKYDGAVTINVWTGYAVLITDSVGNRRVVVGPQTVLLEYNEMLMPMELSTGTPKTTDKILQTVYLRVLNNRVSDLVKVETKDLCPVSLHLSYRVNFEGKESEKWFAVENYVKFLTDHLRSLIKNAARLHGVEVFYRDAINIVRDTILEAKPTQGPRPGRTFPENNMRVYDVEVLDVTIDNPEIAKSLTQAQHSTFMAALKVTEAERDLVNTKRIERAKRGSTAEKALTTKKDKEVEVRAVADVLAVNLATIEAEGKRVSAQLENRLSQERATLDNKLNQQDTLDEIVNAELAREKTKKEQEMALEKAAETQRLELAKEKLEQELQKVHKETEEYVARMQSVGPKVIEALQAFGDKHLLSKAAEAMAPMTLLGGTSAVDVFKRLIDGTPLGEIFGRFAMGNGSASEERVTSR